MDKECVGRRPLFWIAAGVLGFHWCVLAAIPWRMGGVLPAAEGAVFSTRTLMAPAPAPLAALESVKPAPSATAPVHRGTPRSKTPAATAPVSVSVSMPAPTSGVYAVGTEAAEAADTTSALPEAESPAAVAAPAVVAIPNAAPELSASASVPIAPTPAAGAIDILLPGAIASSTRTAPPPVRLPAPMRLEFDVVGQAKGFHYNASALLLWQHDGQHYQAHQEVRVMLLGVRTQTSVGEVSALGLLPQRFGDKSRSEQAAHFDYAQGRATFSANTPPAAIAPGAQDRLSIFIQLGALLAAAPERYPVGTHIRMATVSARAADVWSFSVEGPETLELPVGTVQALKLQRLPRQDYDQKAELWLSPSLGYLPARIRITQTNGDMVDLRLNASAAP